MNVGARMRRGEYGVKKREKEGGAGVEADLCVTEAARATYNWISDCNPEL